MNGLFLYQLQPAFFYTRKDLVTWLFMQTGIHQWLLNNPGRCVLFDALFYSIPLLYLLIYKYVSKLASAVAIIMLSVNWFYVQCYTLYPSNSIEGHIAWLFFPVVFIPADKKTFILLFDGLRYFFLFFFASAAIWKVAQGGLFNISQMSGILLYQHKELLASSPGYWQSDFLLWLIQRPQLAYLLYLSAALLELSFIVGFFTRKYDRLLLVLLVIFLVMDHLIMRITYYEIAPMALTLMFLKERNSMQT
jgi:hypothetical protein